MADGHGENDCWSVYGYFNQACGWNSMVERAVSVLPPVETKHGSNTCTKKNQIFFDKPDASMEHLSSCFGFARYHSFVNVASEILACHYDSTFKLLHFRIDSCMVENVVLKF